VLERWKYSNVVPRGRVYVDTDDLFLFVRTTRSTVQLDHPVYFATVLGSPDFYIEMNDGSCLNLSVEENPEPDVDKVVLRMPKTRVRFELRETLTSRTRDADLLLTSALKYNGSYTASSTTVPGKWGFLRVIVTYISILLFSVQLTILTVMSLMNLDHLYCIIMVCL
jgi:hypothetical protein